MRVDWQGNMLHTAPLPSSGGIALAQLLGTKGDRAVGFKGVELNSAHYIHLLAEIEKHVFAGRADHLGDPDSFKVSVARLTDPTYLKQRAAEASPTAISPTEKVRPGPEPYQTTHFSIVNTDGSAVSNTYTLGRDSGGGMVVKGADSLLNDETDDFSAKPGMANAFDVAGNDANIVEPDKCILSSMSSGIVTRDGKVSLVVGTPGGSRIFTSIFQVLNSIYDSHLSLERAVVTQRVHHQLLPKDTTYYDVYAPFAGKIAEGLKAMSHTLEDQDWNMGDIQVIRVDGETLETTSNPCSRGVGLVVKS